jgi:hypothetical protein
MKKFFKELKQRWILESPPFFKKVGRIGAWMVYIGGAYLVPSATIEGFDHIIDIKFPEILLNIATFLVTAGMFIKITAKLAIEDRSKLDL